MLMVKSGAGAGRPPLGGDRYECGRRKPDKYQRGDLVYRRLVDHWLQFGSSPMHGFQAGRLALHGELSPRQLDTVGIVAKIYGEFERHKGRRRSVASPGYARAYGDPNAGEDELHPDDLAKLERRIKLASKRFLDLQKIIDDLPVNAAKARDVIERLCVEDRMIESAHLPSTRALLDLIRRKLRKKDGPAEPAVNPIAITARRPPRQPERHLDADERLAPKPDLNREAFLAVMKMQGQNDKDAVMAWENFLALRERERFRRGKRLVRS